MTVEFISYGYDTAPGTGLSETTWEEMFPEIGTAMGVRNPGDWKVTPVSGADRTVSIAAGRGWSHGVIDKTVANDTIQLDPVAGPNGTVRWDLIVCRRDPTPSAGKSEFLKINGGATPVIPGARLAGPGIRDQPLALVPVIAGQTQPGTIIDLRTWAGDSGGLIAKDALVLSFLNSTGTRININGSDWRRVPGANDVPEWREYRLDKSLNGGAHVGLTALKTGWTRPYTVGNAKPRVWSTDGITVHSSGLVKFNAGAGEDIIGIPTEYAPAAADPETFIGTTQVSNGATNPAGGPTIALGIKNGVMKIIYQSGTVPIGSLVPITGTWRISE